MSKCIDFFEDLEKREKDIKLALEKSKKDKKNEPEKEKFGTLRRIK